MISLIATDLDGTVVFPNQPLPEEFFSTVRKLYEKGIRFVVCSGRTAGNVERLFAPIADIMNVVASNGAICMAQGEVIHMETICREDVLAISRDLIDAGMDLLVDGRDSVYIFGDKPEYVHSMLYDIRNTVTLIRSLEELPLQSVKVSGTIAHGIHEIIKPLALKWGKRYSTAIGATNWFDVSPSNKADGLQVICRHYGVDPKDVMAFGDSFNDEPMLDYVGHPCIIETANPRLKKQNYRIFQSELEELKKLLHSLS